MIQLKSCLSDLYNIDTSTLCVLPLMSFDGEYDKSEFRNFGVRDSLFGASTNIKHHYKQKQKNPLYIN